VLPSAPDAAGLATLAAELRLPVPVCALLLRRGFGLPDDAKRYLRPRLEQLHDPGLMRGMADAVARLTQAIDGGETILVHGDYDVDGMSSTALLVRVIRALGGTAVPFIPHRLTDGYDLSDAGVDAAIREGARVLLTCDCGTSALAAVARACAAGIDVIISDHHLPGGPLPDCLAILNPRQPGCEYPDKSLVAAGIAYKLAIALVRAMGGDESLVHRHLDLVALATVADVAPLRGENRVLARLGLRMLSQRPSVGLRALVRAVGLDGKAITAGRVGFVLAPRLNAVGRIGRAIRGVELLLADDEHTANAIARELEEMNRERQRIDRETLAVAMRRVESLDLDESVGLVIAEPGWHPGVIGIVASRVVEEVCRPTVLIALEGDVGKGSGRSIPAFDLHAALSSCRDLFVRFGGHRAAAGVTIASSRVEEFTERFNAVAREALSPDDLVHELRVDFELPLGHATEELDALLRHFEPFGIGNPAPVFVARGVRLAGAPRTVGQGHLKLRLEQEGAVLDAIGFGLGALAVDLRADARVDVAFRLELDEWDGAPRLQARLADVRV
jgi:single-stranded-DNA-specific exonuclease